MKKIALLASIFVFIATSAFGMEVVLTCDPNTESDLAGYRIYYSQVKGGPYTKYAQDFPFGPNQVPTFSVTVPDGMTYFVATAYDSEGLESLYSNEVNTNGRPSAPGSLKIQNIILLLTPGN